MATSDSSPNPFPAPAPVTEKLHKILARAGVASRRQCEELIAAGRVVVDGEVQRDVATRVDASTADIQVDGERLRVGRRVHFLFHKPKGVLCTSAQDETRPRVIDYFRAQSARLFTVGRLDEDSEGLILVTNDGSFADRVTHPRHGVLKTYEVTIPGRLGTEELEKIRRGVWISEGKTQVQGIRPFKKSARSTILRVLLAEGRNREIRRIFAKVGCRVRRLRRVAIGPVELGDMKPGQYRLLSEREVREILDSTAESLAAKPAARKGRAQSSGKGAHEKRALPDNRKRPESSESATASGGASSRKSRPAGWAKPRRTTNRSRKKSGRTAR